MNDDTNNNDELFRRASEHYPLKTDSADWEAVRAKMNAAADAPEPALPKKKRNYKYLLLLLLLIPLFIFENKYEVVGKYLGGNKSEKANPTTARETIPASQPNPTSTSTVPLGNEQGETTQQTPGSTTGSSTDQAARPIQEGNDQTKIIKGNDNDELFAKNKNSFQSKNRSKTAITNAAATEDETTKDDSDLVPVNDPNKKSELKTDRLTMVKTTEAIPESDDSKSTPEAVDEAKVKKEEVKKETGIEKDKKEPVTNTSKKEDKKDKKSNKRFYIGLIAGPDFSAVKLQSVKKTGLNFGFVAGYKISNRFAIETGLLKDKKFYNTDGKHFSTKNIYLPPNATIQYAAGECNMLEWPVNLRYTFNEKAKSAWFASAGVSSYFMKDESYVYDVEHIGYVYPYSSKYKNKSTSLLAVINLSAGYTYKLGKIADLRIEPYLKLPVGKIGTGNLPIQSFGISVGVTKNIF